MKAVINLLLCLMVLPRQAVEGDMIQGPDGNYYRFHCHEACTPPWEFHEGVGCLYFCSDTKIFDDARQDCIDIGGDLFVAEDEEHFETTRTHFLTLTGLPSILWVGAKAREWLNGRPVSVTEWAAGQPDNNPATSCGAMLSADNFYLHDDGQNCNDNFGFVCEKPHPGFN